MVVAAMGLEICLGVIKFREKALLFEWTVSNKRYLSDSEVLLKPRIPVSLNFYDNVLCRVTIQN